MKYTPSEDAVFQSLSKVELDSPAARQIELFPVRLSNRDAKGLYWMLSMVQKTSYHAFHPTDKIVRGPNCTPSFAHTSGLRDSVICPMQLRSILTSVSSWTLYPHVSPG